MHILHQEFAIARDEALDFAAARGFGLFVAHDGERPIGSHLPFMLRREDTAATLHMHVTLANPLAALAECGREFLCVVTGADSYVSNDWYATTDNVSTWLYEAVHLTGTARRLEPGANRAHGEALLAMAEARLAPKLPWKLDAMEPRKRAAMLAQIVSLEVAVTRVEGQRKHNQRKPDADHIAVVRMLERTGEAAGLAIAARMRAARPGVDYGGPDGGVGLPARPGLHD